MVRVKGSRIIFLILSVLIVCTFLCVPAGAEPVTVGISVTSAHVSEASLDRGDSFTVNVVSPVLTDNSDSTMIRVYYDSDVLEFLGWNKHLDPGEYESQYSGLGRDERGTFFGLAASSGKERRIPTVGGIEIAALMKVKDTARTTSTVLTLTTHTISYTVEDNVQEHVELWGDTVDTNLTAKLNLIDLPFEKQVTGGGIYVDKDLLDNNEELTVTVKVPKIAWDASPADIRVYYDPYDFELVSWEPGIGVKYQSADGYYGVTFPDNAPELDNALELKAILCAKTKGISKESTISLKQDIKYEGLDLWIRLDQTSATVTLTGVPAIGGGLTATAESVKRGKTFDVIVEVPAFPRQAGQLSVIAGFDPAVFEVKSWNPVVAGADVTADYNNTQGTITLNARAGGNTIDMSLGYSFRATLAAKENAVLGQSKISLTKAFISLPEYDSNRNVWNPENVECLVTVAGDFPRTGGGISLSKSSTTTGERFSVYVNVPEIYANAVNAAIKVDFDAEAFEIISLDAGASGLTAAAGNGSFTFSAAGADIPLSGGLTLTANMKVSDDATGGSYTFRLSSSSLANGTAASLWTPDNTSAVMSVTVTKLFPVTGGGISSLKRRVRTDESFDVMIEIPPIDSSADTAVIEVRYDSSAFEVLSWQPNIPGVVSPDLGSGYFGFAVADLANKIDLSRGLTMSANMKVRTTAIRGSYNFTLYKNELSYRKKNGTIQALWKPETVTCSVSVIGEDERFPATGGGLTLSEYQIESGDSFTAFINVPAISASASRSVVSVDFDSSAFEIVSLDADMAGFTSSKGTGSFTFTGTGDSVSLRNGVTFTAKLKAKKTAYGSYSLRLNKSSFINTDNGIEEEMWQPNITYASIDVTAGGFPVTSGGIGVSKGQVTRGGTFSVTVTIPACKAVASDMMIQVDFDDDAFEVTSWKPTGISGLDSTYGSGYFMLDLSGGNADLSKGYTFTAKMKALSYADLGKYSFDLVNAYIGGVPYGGTTEQDLWFPTKDSASVSITSSSSVDPTPTPTPIDNTYPIRSGGISLSRSEASSGDLFTVYVNVPSAAVYADYGTFTVQFDSNIFDVVSWSPYSSGGVPTYGAGYFAYTVSAYNGIDLSRGLMLSATLKVKNNSRYGRYTFNLVGSSFRKGTTELWTPVMTSAYMNVSTNSYSGGSGSGSGGGWYPSGINPPNPGGWGYDPYKPAQTTTKEETPSYTIINNIVMPDGYGSTPATTSGNGYVYYPEDEEPIDPPDEDHGRDVSPYDIYDDVPDSDSDTTKRPSPTPDKPSSSDVEITTGDRKPQISLITDLNGIDARNIKAKSRPSYFGGDTIIYIRNTAEADEAGANALALLRQSDHRSYAFDISVYDTVSGTYIHSIPKGYIDFDIPIPNALTVDSGDISVYHINKAVPELIDSVIVTEGGVRKIHFRATEFSPYMFVDNINLKAQNSAQANSGSTGGTVNYPNTNTGSSGGGNYIVGNNNTGNGSDSELITSADSGSGGRNANPHTGGTGLIIIPAGAVACILLAKGNKKRKRSTRR